MLADALADLRCPFCGGGLALGEGAVVRCAAGHSFDVARQGYLNLLPGNARTGSADTAAMVRARSGFLADGHFAPLSDALAGAAAAALAGPRAPAGAVVEIGAGTGHHLAAVLDRLPDRRGIALDISKHALRAAARAHPRAVAVGCDAWGGLPLADGAAALALSVFAPRDPAELARVVVPGGALVVATPEPGHLAEAVAAVGMLSVPERKRERVAGQLDGAFEPVGQSAVRATLELDAAALGQLVAMGPSARHLDGTEIDRRVAALGEPFTVTVAVAVATYRRRP